MRGVVELDIGMGESASAKGGETPEIQLTWDWRNSKRRGRGTRSGVKQQSISAYADHGDTGRDDGSGTLRELPLPLDGG